MSLRWDPKREAWIVEESRQIRALLSEPALSSRRPQGRSAQESGPSVLTEGLSRWPMFSDGREHVVRREMAVAVLRQRFSPQVRTVLEARFRERAAAAAVLAANDGLDVVGYAADCAMEAVGILCGLETSGMKSLAQDGDLIVQAIGGVVKAEAEEAWSRVAMAMEESARFRPSESVFGLLVSQYGDHGRDDCLAVAINIVVDGVAPIASAIATALLLGSEEVVDARARRALVQRALAEEAPFQFCGRRASQNLELGDTKVCEGDRVELRIGQAAKADHRLAFGAGPHQCPARAFSRFVVEQGVGTLLNEVPYFELIGPEEWAPSRGYRALTKLRIGVPGVSGASS